jgi:hypothetical protein
MCITPNFSYLQHNKVSHIIHFWSRHIASHSTFALPQIFLHCNKGNSLSHFLKLSFLEIYHMNPNFPFTRCITHKITFNVEYSTATIFLSLRNIAWNQDFLLCSVSHQNLFSCNIPRCTKIYFHTIPLFDPWFIAWFFLCDTPWRKKISSHATCHTESDFLSNMSWKWEVCVHVWKCITQK